MPQSKPRGTFSQCLPPWWLELKQRQTDKPSARSSTIRGLPKCLYRRARPPRSRRRKRSDVALPTVFFIHTAVDRIVKRTFSSLLCQQPFSNHYREALNRRRYIHWVSVLGLIALFGESSFLHRTRLVRLSTPRVARAAHPHGFFSLGR